MSVNHSTFSKNSSLPFSSNTKSLRLRFIQSISLSVIFLLISSGSNQGYLSSDVDLFVSSAGNSVHVVMVEFLQDGLVSHMLMVMDLMWQVSFCHEGTDLWENVSNYLFVLGP